MVSPPSFLSRLSCHPRMCRQNLGHILPGMRPSDSTRTDMYSRPSRRASVSSTKRLCSNPSRAEKYLQGTSKPNLPARGLPFKAHRPSRMRLSKWFRRGGPGWTMERLLEVGWGGAVQIPSRLDGLPMRVLEVPPPVKWFHPRFWLAGSFACYRLPLTLAAHAGLTVYHSAIVLQVHITTTRPLPEPTRKRKRETGHASPLRGSSRDEGRQ